MDRLRTRWLFAICLMAAVSVVFSACQVESNGNPDNESEDSAAAVATETAGDDESAVSEAEDSETEEAPDEAGGDFPFSVIRTDGETLTIAERPERIISMSPGATEILYAIGAGDQVIAADMFSDYPPEAADLPKLDAYQPNPEAIVDFEPDLVIMVYDADGIVSTLDELDVPVLFLDAPASLDGLLEHIELYGDFTGNTADAEALVSDLAERIAAVEAAVTDAGEGPRVYHELDENFFTVGPGSFIGDVYQKLNAENIADGSMGDYPQLSEEIILERDPEMIVVPAFGDDESATEAIRSRAGWDAISAVRNDRIYEIDGDIISRPGPRIIDALEQLAAVFYPEEFERSDESGFAPDGLSDDLAPAA